MSDTDKRLAAVHVEDEGRMACVWVMHDKLSDCVTVYDACKFNNEVLVVIAEGLNARGRWIPIAWESKSKDVADKLLEKGCSMLYEPLKESPVMAQMLSRDLEERMRTGRFKVDQRLGEWKQEFKVFNESGGKVPLGSFPLMAATRYAIACLDQGKRFRSIAKRTVNAPKVAMI
jgi:hypothetical protein